MTWIVPRALRTVRLTVAHLRVALGYIFVLDQRVVNRSPRGTHDTRKHTFTATVTEKHAATINRTR